MLSVVLVAVLALLAPSHARSADLTKSEEAAIRNAIDSALEDLRQTIFNGDPDSGIPVLDPLVVNNFEFEVDEDPVVHAEGSLSQARMEGLGSFVVEESKIKITLIPLRATITMAIRVPDITAVGNYKLSGEAHTRTDIAVDADGKFTVSVKDPYFRVQVTVSYPSYKVKSIDVTLGLGDVFIDVEGAGDVGELINDEAAVRIKEFLANHRTELEDKIEELVTYYIENVM